jgi:hypothetical protein
MKAKLKGLHYHFPYWGLNSAKLRGLHWVMPRGKPTVKVSGLNSGLPTGLHSGRPMGWRLPRGLKKVKHLEKHCYFPHWGSNSAKRWAIN